IALAAQGTAVPLQVTVNKIHTYKTAIGSLWLLGEVINDGEEPVENIQVEIGLLGADGRSLATAAAWAATSIILPDERSPFAILINEPPVDFTLPIVSVVAGQVVIELGTRYLDVAVTESAISHSGDSVTLTGSFQNEGAEVANNVQIIATFYDSEGNVTGFQQQVVAETLQVGEERPFALETTPPGGKTIAFTLQIEAQITINN
ncbi:MAG: hypothetical protein GY805_01380, partial [Chloroflexi bacterium]|nr:hypothetical protein [Chloroflexota bacterium]